MDPTVPSSTPVKAAVAVTVASPGLRRVICYPSVSNLDHVTASLKDNGLKKLPLTYADGW